MRTKLFAMAIVGCLELFAVSNPANAQYFGLGGRRWGVTVAAPVYYDGYYGYRGYYEPGGYYGWGEPFFGYRGYRADNAYFYPPHAFGNVLDNPYLSSYHIINPPAAPAVVDPSVSVAALSPSDTVAQPAVTFASQSFYSAPAADNKKMEFRVRLPAADAKLYFNDQLVDQQGAERSLTTPATSPGVYDYRVKATWMENGLEKSELHDVRLQPGQTATVQFGMPKVIQR